MLPSYEMRTSHALKIVTTPSESQDHTPHLRFISDSRSYYLIVSRGKLSGPHGQVGHECQALPPVEPGIAQTDGGNGFESFTHNDLFLRVQVLSIPLAQRIRQDRIRRKGISILSIAHKRLHSLLVMERLYIFIAALNDHRTRKRCKVSVRGPGDEAMDHIPRRRNNHLDDSIHRRYGQLALAQT